MFGSQFLFTRYALTAYLSIDIGMIHIVIGMLGVFFLALFFTEHTLIFISNGIIILSLDF